MARTVGTAVALATAFVALALLSGGASAAAGVDVGVQTPDISFSTSTPVDGSNITIFVTVHNFGDTDASSVLVTAEVTSNGALIGQATLATVFSQGVAEASIPWDVSGEGNMTVTVSVAAAEVDANPADNRAISANIFVRSRPDLRVDSVYFDNPAPPAGTVAVTIFAQVSNIGGSDAQVVKVAFYDGPPASSNEIYNTTLATVTITSPRVISFIWDVQDKGGRHDIYARVESSTPGEKPTTAENDVNTGRLLVLTNFDIIVVFGETKVIPFDTLQSGFVIVRNGGNLSVVNSTVTLHEQTDNQYDIIVETGGVLWMWNGRITADHSFGFTLQNGATVAMRAGSQIDGAVASSGASFWAWDATINGGFTGSYSTLWVENSTVNGDVVLIGTAATFKNSEMNTDNAVHLTSSTLNAEWLTLSVGSTPSLRLSDHTQARLAGLSSGLVLTEGSSGASIWRQAEFQVSDLSGIPIGAASVTANFYLNNTPVGSAMTDSDGKAALWLLTDLLGAGSPQYVGSYLFTATYASYTVSAVENLPYYPDLTGDSSHVPVSLVFEVIDPADLFAASPGDDHVGPGQVWAYADFMQDGNLFIEGGLVTFSGAFVLDQDFDYQKAVVLRSGRLTLTPASSFSSNHRFNLYLYNSSELVVDGGFVSVNALVTFGSSVVSIDNGSVFSGSFILQGSSFTLGSGVRASGAQLYARGATSIQLLGAEVQVVRVDVMTNGDITINNTILGASGDLILRSNEGAGKALRIANSVLAGSDMQLEGATMDIAATQFLTTTVSRFWANSIVARQSSFTAHLTGFKSGSGSVFYDVAYPTLQVDPGAIVSTFHRLSLVVVDVNNNIVTSGNYEIKLVPEGTPAGSGELAPVVEKDLAASTIVQGVETFFGNYEVTVTATGISTPVVRSVVMDGAQNVVVAFPQELVLPTAVVIAATVQPSSILPGETLFVNGTVLLSYAGRGGLTPPTSSLTVDISSSTIITASVNTAADGSFSWSGPYVVPDSRSGIQTVKAATSYRGVAGSTELSFELRPAPPTGLVVNLENARFEKRTSEQFVVAGTVLFNNGKPAENIAVTVIFTIPASGEAYTGRTDANGIFSVTIPGRRTAATYSLNVRAEDPDHGLVQVSAPITVVVSAGQIGTSNTGLFSGTTLLIVGLIGAAIVVGFVALLVNAKRKSANYVECGNCGRPAREGDRKCPSCGVEFEEDIAKCSHCASWIPANASRCPKCNTEFKPIDEAITAKAEAAEQAPVEEARAEVTTPATPVKAPVAVKKKVLKTAEPAAPAGKKDEFANPWEQPETQQAPAQAPAQPKPAEKKPEEKKEKGLFDDL